MLTVNSYDEISIDLIDLLKRILKRWKFVLAIGAVFSLMTTGYFAYKEHKDRVATEEFISQGVLNLDYLTYSIANIAKDLIPEENPYDTSKIDIVVNAVNQYDSYQKEIDFTRNQINTSPFLKLSTELIPTEEIYYLIDINSEDWEHITKNRDAADIGLVVSNIVRSDDTLDELKSALGLDESFDISELLYVGCSNDIMYIGIYGQSREQCDEIAEEYSIIIDKLIPQINEQLGVKFSLVPVGKNYTETKGNIVLSRQNALYDSIASITEKMENLSKDFSSDTKELYDEIMTVKYVAKNGTEEEFEEFYKPKESLFNIKGMIIGLFLGVMAACGYITFKYITGNKLRVSNEIYMRFGIANCMNEDNVRSLMSKKNIEKLFVTGAAADEASIKSSSFENAQAVLLAEKIDLTNMEDVKKEIEKCTQHEIPILGYIVIS